MKQLPSIEELFDLFFVDSTSPTGLRYAKDRHKCKAGDQAGWLEDRYFSVYVGGRAVKAHRVVMAMRSGFDPGLEVDHKDRNGKNNHPFNLRWASRLQNAANTSCKGVYFNGRHWEYRFQRNGKKYYESGFTSAQGAYTARAHRIKELAP